MAAPVIPISPDSSKKSVGSHVPRVILVGTIPTSILVIPVVTAEFSITPVVLIFAPEVGAVSVISPTKVLDLVDYSSSSDLDPSEDSLPRAPELPLVSPFLCSDDLEADTILVRPGKAIPFGRPYRTHLNGPHRHSSPDFISDSFSSGSSLDSSSDISLGSTSYSLSDSSSVHSLGRDASGQSHSGPSTRVASPRLFDPTVRTLRCSEAFMCWKSVPLSISPALADLSPRKRFNDSYSFEVSGEEHMEIGTADTETVVDLNVSDRVRAPIGLRRWKSSDCLKLKDQNRGNKTGNKNRICETKGKAYVLGGGDTNPDSNVITRHPFNIDLMPVELGSFDIIIGMDWLANHHAVIVCDEKIVQITYGDEVLIFQGDRNGKGKKSKLSILSSPKTQKYIKKGFLIFLAQVMKKETKDKSGEKRTEDVSTVRDFPEVFPEDLHGLPPTRQVEF
nr:reverse transcriptase domain-containing protein [Tanacetum cinerariifolium]